LTGVAIGIGGALALVGVMKGLLFHVSATDPATYVGVALAFVAVALVAGYIPARRATPDRSDGRSAEWLGSTLGSQFFLESFHEAGSHFSGN
jgi:threonine/homoserine efflux transporter RhtA